MTLFSQTACKAVAVTEILQDIFTDDDYTRNNNIEVNENKATVNTIALFHFLYLKLLSYGMHTLSACYSVY